MRWSRRRFLEVTLTAAGGAWLAACSRSTSGAVIVAPTPDPTPTVSPPVVGTAEPTPPPREWPRYDADLHRVVDKQHALPEGYAPADLVAIPAAWHAQGFGGLVLREQVVAALEPMVAAAEWEGVELRIRSAYRSYEEQVWTFEYWIGVYGEEEARRRSAEPGHSEHQLGSTFDLASPENGWELDRSFANSTAGRWIRAHGHEYGFALSYPEEGEAITGYMYEPWHWRYVGIEAARQWHESGETLVEYLAAFGEAARDG